MPPIKNLLTRTGRLPGDRFAPTAAPGLMWAYRFRDGSKPDVLEAQDLPSALAEESGWIWVHIDVADTLARKWVADLTQLPEAARALFAAKEEQLGLDSQEDAVFGIIADFETDLDQPTEDVGRLRFALTPRLAVTGRRHRLRSVEDIHRDVPRGLVLKRPGALIDAIADRFCDSVARLSAAMTDELDAIEDHVVADLVARERARLMPVRRTAVRLHRQLASLSAVFRSWDDDTDEEEDEDERPATAISAGRLATRFASLDQEILSVQDRAKLLQDEVAARLADETNKSLRALSVMTALLLPGSLISSIFGMNVHGLPFLESPGGFEVVIVMGVLATAAFYYLLRRAGGV